MLKITMNLMYTLMFFAFIEFMLYVKDYNELMIMCGYIRYEMKNDGLRKYKNYKWEIDIREDKYIVTMNRESIFSFEKYKKIKYIGIVE